MAADSRVEGGVALPDAPARARAIDPDHSVLVQAPAGSGKTTLLVERYLNLLERVERPEEILALTFTRRAAAEMRKRILAALALDDPRSERIRGRDERFGWNLGLVPQGLRIQTIDSFAYDVASSDASSSASGRPTIARDARSLYEAAADLVFARLRRPDPFHDEICAFLELHQNDHNRARASLIALLEHREQWLDAVRAALTDRGRDGGSAARRLQQSVDALHVAAIAAVERDVTSDERDALLSIAATAATSSTSSTARARGQQAPDAAETHGDSWDEWPATRRWREVARVMVTDSGALRSRFDARIGLAANDPLAAGARSRAAALARALSGRDAELALVWLADLPAPIVAERDFAALHPIAVTLALAASALTEAFTAHGLVDFAELTSLARRALGATDAPSDLALALDYRVKHVLVDEFQDTSAAQMDLLRRLVAGWQAGDGRTFFGVGDPMQSIYRFRDADVSLYLAAASEGIDGYPLERVVLERNFRSRPAIVDWCNAVLGAAFGANAHRETGTIAYAPASAPWHSDVGSVEVICFAPEDGDDASRREAAEIATRIERLRAQHPNDSIAVLARNRAYAEPLIAALDAVAIPWRGADIRLLADEPVVRDLLMLYRVAAEPDDRLAWLALLRSPLVGLELTDLLHVAERVPRLPARAQWSLGFPLSADGVARLARLDPIVAMLSQSVAELPTRQWLENAWLRLGGADAYDDVALEQADAFFSLVERETPERPDRDALERALDRLFARSSGRESDVQIMTIHRAKGLEFDHVFAPALDRPGGGDDAPAVMSQVVAGHALLGSAAYADDGSIYAWLARQAALRDANERVRLLYVAATRARRSLTLSAVASKDPSTAPDSRSLLAPIWSLVRASARYPEAARERKAAQSTSDLDARLPAAYRWSPPITVAPIDAHLPARRDEPAADATDIDPLLRRTLADIARAPRLRERDAGRAARNARIRAIAQSYGARDRLDELVARVEQLVEGMLGDAVGAWILDRDGACETTVRGAIPGRIVSATIARTFKDVSGTQWVIAYGSDASESDRASDRARDALDLAAHLFHQITARPVRAGVYVVARRALIEWSTNRDPVP